MVNNITIHMILINIKSKNNIYYFYWTYTQILEHRSFCSQETKHLKKANTSTCPHCFHGINLKILTFELNLVLEELLVVQLQLLGIQAVNSTEIKLIITANFKLKVQFAIIAENMSVTFHILVTTQTDRMSTLLNVYINPTIDVTTRKKQNAAVLIFTKTFS